MSLIMVTATAITAAPVLITATVSLFGEPTTVTTNVFTTTFGLPRQTITIFPQTVTAGEPKYTPYPTGSILPPLYTVTVNEVDAFVQALSGTVWTRVFYDETGNAAKPILAYWGEPYVPEEKVMVLPSTNDGWSNWSKSQKVLMCVGLVLFVFAMLLLWWCCLDRGNEWIVQPGARYWNGGYWGAGLRGGGGRFNIARIALKWRKTDATREENRERAENVGNNPRDQGHGQTNPQQESSRALGASQ